MGRVPRNLLGSMTVLIMVIFALTAALKSPWLAAAFGGLALLRLVVLVRDWNKGARR